MDRYGCTDLACTLEEILVIREFCFSDTHSSNDASQGHRRSTWQTHTEEITLSFYLLHHCFSEVQNCKYKLNILRVRWIHAFSVVILAPVFCQRTLDVIIERQVTVAVFLQQTKRIVVCKVLKLYQCPLTIPTQIDRAHSLTHSIWTLVHQTA